ncbi:hypothetical protein SO802_030180 [Lithocarpus litseifolius]|uniref:non-specific serine/threonine protein kinase n=1 Tax=Lithocarpus litseifolius TaxID=425828 RepID=A0AAW2BVB0_9ROSI
MPVHFSCQMIDLADIAHCVSEIDLSKEGSHAFLLACMQDLQDVLLNSKLKALVIDRHLWRLNRETFAVLKKLDMIRKNDVDRILAKRNILITVRNPFVVRFFYSFTCRDNLYLVMEYLNGGVLYSLKKVGCLDEDVARIYIAELVLALEYLHSLGIVHHDLKPDNILIAQDGHIKLTDFGLSKIGLINSKMDLSGPQTNGTTPDAHNPHAQQTDDRRQHSAVGTPDYLAPEILLGTEHDLNSSLSLGYAADWWSVGIILFELITGIPPFTAERPKVKAHPFFRGVNWDSLALQKNLSQLAAINHDVLLQIGKDLTKCSPSRGPGLKKRKKRLILKRGLKKEKKKRLTLYLEKERKRERLIDPSSANPRRRVMASRANQTDLPDLFLSFFHGNPKMATELRTWDANSVDLLCDFVFSHYVLGTLRPYSAKAQVWEQITRNLNARMG